MPTIAWEHVADAAELTPGERKSVFIDDQPALLVRLGDEYFAIEDVCSHDGQPLTDGELVAQSIECPRHGARFDLATGAALCMPATKAIQTFLVEVRTDGIYAAVRPAGMVVTPRASTSAAPTAAGDATSTATTPAAEAAASVAPPAPPTSPEAGAAAPAEPSSDEESGEVDDAAIIEALRQVIDPELMVNIVDLGLVYTVNHADRKAIVEMTLTSPACPAGPQIVQQSKMVVERLNGIDEAQIKLTMSPPWTPDRMTDEARDQLGFF